MDTKRFYELTALYHALFSLEAHEQDKDHFEQMLATLRDEIRIELVKLLEA